MNKRSALLATIVGGVALGALYQNMTPVEFAALNMPPIDEAARRDQAQELLGPAYHTSFAARLEGDQELNYLIYKKLESSLSTEWKSWLPQITEVLIQECQKRDLDPIFVMAIIQTESRFNAYAKGSSGEIGLMQILPQTAEWIAKKHRLPWRGPNSLYDPITNLKLGIAYFAHLRSQFDSRAYHYVPAYNMGPKNLRQVARTIASLGEDERRLLHGIYGSKVMKNYQMIYMQLIERKAKPLRFAKEMRPPETSFPEIR